MKKNLVPGQRPPIGEDDLDRVSRAVAIILSAAIVAVVVAAGVLQAVCR